jgi:hypothetical protein
MAWLALTTRFDQSVAVNTQTISHVAPHAKGTKIYFNFNAPNSEGVLTQKVLVVRDDYTTVLLKTKRTWFKTIAAAVSLIAIAPIVFRLVISA